MWHVLSGGFAKGWRTEILACMAAVTTIVSYMVGDTDLLHAIPLVTASLGALAAKHSDVGK